MSLAVGFESGIVPFFLATITIGFDWSNPAVIEFMTKSLAKPDRLDRAG
jgi:hypothetical protein